MKHRLSIDTAGKPCVADFGLALKDKDFGKFGGLAGTPSCMNPEQARGEGLNVFGYNAGRRNWHADSRLDSRSRQQISAFSSNYVNCSLEATYQTAWSVFPAVLKPPLERPGTAPETA